MSNPFEARFDGRCSACLERIHAGDPVQFDAFDSVVHVDCEAAAPPERPTQPICPDCFTELPVTGVCGVCV